MKTLRSFFRFAFLLAFTFTLALVIDFGFAFFEKPLPLPVIAAIFVLSTAAFLLLRTKPSGLWVFFIFAVVVATAISFFLLQRFNSMADYNVSDSGKAQLYADKNVLVLVPHQDDEIIVAGGVIEEYIKYGSKVNFAFVTNGDYATPGETRLQEALSVAVSMGIPEENVFFLGYGDRGAASLYMAPNGELVPTHAGYEHTYGLESHPAYNEGRAYQRENLLDDLRSLLLQLKADLIFCVEIEEHMDHAAVSMFLDEALAEILKTELDYKPTVLKSSCYATALYSADDFYTLNILATQDPSEGEHFAGLYDWEDRIRLPIHGEGLSRSLFGCDSYEHLRLHKSQIIHENSEFIINGDRVFWLRDTHSLCYNATIETSSGYGKFLNDFKIADRYDLTADFKHLSDNVWAPDDSEKTASVTLAEPAYIDYICLYDNPDLQVNVLNVLITFDDGSSIESGALKARGATVIPVKKDSVSSFSVKLLDNEGEGAGLTEIEAYTQAYDHGLDFIKLTDMQGNFVYDYFIDENGSESFAVYASTSVDGDYVVSSDNPNCSVKYENGLITVRCPKEQSCVVTVSSEDGLYSDTVRISNPGRFLRETGPQFERLVRQFLRSNIQQSASYQFVRSLYHLVF